MKDFRQLKVWARGHSLTLAVYRATAGFPITERYGLVSQLRRAAASIPANIAEGCGRSGPAEPGRFLQIAMGSLSELDYHILLARDLRYLSSPAFDEVSSEVVELRRMLASLIYKICPDRR